MWRLIANEKNNIILRKKTHSVNQQQDLEGEWYNLCVDIIVDSLWGHSLTFVNCSNKNFVGVYDSGYNAKPSANPKAFLRMYKKDKLVRHPDAK